MSTLRSALDELRGEDVVASSDEELEDDLAEIERASRVLEAERSRRLTEVERRRAWAVDGHLSVVSWIAARHRVGFARATAHVRLARALHRMPATARALGEAQVSSEATTLLVRAREAAPAAFAESEPMLVEAAANLSPRGLRSAVTYWLQAADAAGARDRERQQRERRGLHVSALLDDMVRIDGELDPESGQTVITALRSVQDAGARVDTDREATTPPQRRADALVELCRTHLDRTDRASVAGERPHVVVTMDLEAIRGRAGGRADLEDVGPVTPETARRIACDAGVSRVVFAGASEPLDVGRKTPVVPAALRRALVVRDRGCRFSDCGRPQAWCDAHHVRHWADGGPTSLRNLVLLCRPHHRAVHERFHVSMAEGVPRFTRADGSVLLDRGPP